MKKPVHNPREVAEIVAVQALSFIAADPERLGLFLAESGIGPETLRTAAAVRKVSGPIPLSARNEPSRSGSPAMKESA